MAIRNLGSDVHPGEDHHEHRRYRRGHDRGHGRRALGKGRPSGPVRDAPSGILRTAARRGGAQCVGGLAGGGRAFRRDRLLFGPLRRLAVAGAGACAARLGQGVLDSANPYPGRDGDFARAAIAAGEGAGVPVARLLPGTRLVRAFNSVYFKTLQTEAHRAGDRVGIPLASDDAAALDAAARSGPGRGVRAGRRWTARKRALLRSGDPGLQHRHERRGPRPRARRRPDAVTRLDAGAPRSRLLSRRFASSHARSRAPSPRSGGVWPEGPDGVWKAGMLDEGSRRRSCNPTRGRAAGHTSSGAFGATFPAELGKGSARHLRCLNARSARREGRDGASLTIAERLAKLIGAPRANEVDGALTCAEHALIFFACRP